MIDLALISVVLKSREPTVKLPVISTFSVKLVLPLIVGAVRVVALILVPLIVCPLTVPLAVIVGAVTSVDALIVGADTEVVPVIEPELTEPADNAPERVAVVPAISPVTVSLAPTVVLPVLSSVAP